MHYDEKCIKYLKILKEIHFYFRLLFIKMYSNTTLETVELLTITYCMLYSYKY